MPGAGWTATEAFGGFTWFHIVMFLACTSATGTCVMQGINVYKRVVVQDGGSFKPAFRTWHSLCVAVDVAVDVAVRYPRAALTVCDYVDSLPTERLIPLLAVSVSGLCWCITSPSLMSKHIRLLYLICGSVFADSVVRG